MNMKSFIRLLMTKFKQPIDIVLIFGILTLISLYMSLEAIRWASIYTDVIGLFIILSVFFLIMSAISVIIVIKTVEEIKNDDYK